MLTAIRHTLTVPPEGSITVHALPPGARVEVLIVIEPEVETKPDFEPSELRQALMEAGYTTREKIVRMVREVKKEIADET